MVQRYPCLVSTRNGSAPKTKKSKIRLGPSASRGNAHSCLHSRFAFSCPENNEVSRILAIASYSFVSSADSDEGVLTLVLETTKDDESEEPEVARNDSGADHNKPQWRFYASNDDDYKLRVSDEKRRLSDQVCTPTADDMVEPDVSRSGEKRSPSGQMQPASDQESPVLENLMFTLSDGNGWKLEVQQPKMPQSRTTSIWQPMTSPVGDPCAVLTQEELAEGAEDRSHAPVDLSWKQQVSNLENECIENDTDTDECAMQGDTTEITFQIVTSPPVGACETHCTEASSPSAVPETSADTTISGQPDTNLHVATNVPVMKAEKISDLPEEDVHVQLEESVQPESVRPEESVQPEISVRATEIKPLDALPVSVQSFAPATPSSYSAAESEQPSCSAEPSFLSVSADLSDDSSDEEALATLAAFCQAKVSALCVGIGSADPVTLPKEGLSAESDVESAISNPPVNASTFTPRVSKIGQPRPISTPSAPAKSVFITRPSAPTSSNPPPTGSMVRAPPTVHMLRAPTAAPAVMRAAAPLVRSAPPPNKRIKINSKVKVDLSMPLCSSRSGDVVAMQSRSLLAPSGCSDSRGTSFVRPPATVLAMPNTNVYSPTLHQNAVQLIQVPASANPVLVQQTALKPDSEPVITQQVLQRQRQPLQQAFALTSSNIGLIPVTLVNSSLSPAPLQAVFATDAVASQVSGLTLGAEDATTQELEKSQGTTTAQSATAAPTVATNTREHAATQRLPSIEQIFQPITQTSLVSTTAPQYATAGQGLQVSASTSAVQSHTNIFCTAAPQRYPYPYPYPRSGRPYPWPYYNYPRGYPPYYYARQRPPKI